MRGKGHGLVLYLTPELVLSLAELQYIKKLGRSYAGLLALTEGFHQLGVLSDEDYEEAKDRYSVSLVQRNKKSLTLEELKEKETLEELENLYSRALNQWSIMKEKAKQYYLKKAEKDAEKVKNARLVLDLANDGEVSAEVLEKENSP